MMDFVALIEACYRLDGDSSTWLRGVIEAARPVLDLGHGVVGVLQNIARPLPEPPEVLAFGMSGLSQEALASFASVSRAASSPDVARRFQMRGPVGTFSRTLGHHGAEFKRVIYNAGIADALYMLTGDTSGVHCALAMLSREKVQMSRRKGLLLGQIAAHIATGLRLTRAKTSGPEDGNAPGALADGNKDLEAILTPEGTLEHALGAATSSDGRDALRQAVSAIERARGAMRRRDPEDAVQHWQALVAGRWSLVDHFDSDGRRFLVARPNEPNGIGFSALSMREQQVVGLAAHGHSYKLIAYELGLTVSTVSTHLARATAKLGIDSRRSLLALLSQAPPHLAGDKELGPHAPHERSV